MAHDLGKILIIRLSSIGDILLTTPLLRSLRKQFPDSQIDFLVKSEYSELLRFNPWCSRIIEIDSRIDRNLNDVSNGIRNEHYDLLLDLHNSIRSRYIRFFSEAKKIRVVNKYVVPRFILVHTKKNFYPGIVPVAERYLAAAKDFGVSDDGEGLEIFIPSEVSNSLRARLLESGVDPAAGMMAIAPAARHRTKMWLPERFAALAIAAVRRYKLKIVILGDAAMRPYCEQITKTITASAGEFAGINLAGQFSLLETAALLDASRLLVTNDSGLMHLAAARKCRVVAIFGPTVGEFGFFPYRTESKVIEEKSLSCRPCSHLGGDKCPLGHFRCMKDISVERVLEAAAEYLSASR